MQKKKKILALPHTVSRTVVERGIHFPSTEEEKSFEINDTVLRSVYIL
jgi:hypothetical protein